MSKALTWIRDKGRLVWVEVEMDELAVLTVENEILPIETRVLTMEFGILTAEVGISTNETETLTVDEWVSITKIGIKWTVLCIGEMEASISELEGLMGEVGVSIGGNKIIAFIGRCGMNGPMD